MTATVDRRSAWIPWTFAGGMLVVIAVNAVLITTALTSFPGLVVQRPYDRGIAYNDELRRSQAQAALGWTIAPHYESGRLIVGFRDANGASIPGLVAHATMSRPLGADMQVEADLVRVGDVYEAELALPKHGQWELRVDASGAAGTYRSTYRMTVP